MSPQLVESLRLADLPPEAVVLSGAAVYGEWPPRGEGEEVLKGRADALPLDRLAATMPEVHAQLTEATARLESDSRDVQDIEFSVESGAI